MSDNIVDFDLSKPVQEVKRFDDALDRLNKQMENINKRNFRNLVSEVENMRNIGTEAQRKFAADAAATANKIMQSWDLSAMSKKQRTELKSALDKLHSDMVAFYKANAEVAVRFNDQHWKQLIEGARRNGRSYTEVSFTTDREIVAGRAKTYKTLEQLEAAHNEATLKASKTLADLRAKSATPMNLDETRRLLGLPDRDGMKSFAATIKGQMQEALSSEKLRAKSATPMNLDETRRLLGLPDRSQMDRLAAQIRGQMLEAVDLSKYQKIARGRGINVQDVVGEFSVLPTGPKAVKLPDPAQINGVSTALKRLTIDGNDAHSMARGLASGFNLLWLTWGNLVPLFTGAGISFGLKKTFDIGSEVEYQIKFMEVLGQTTVTQSGIIRQALREIDQTTQFTLVELSQAMVRLGQAGQTPKEALATLKPAADLASLGMVDLKVSTDLLIQTQALFGKTAADSGKMAAQIFEITKSGVLNVEDIAGSMKYASEANTRFGKTLEETLALLGALAQAGLKANTGGTAYINFLRDLNGRSGPAIAAMKELEKTTGTTIKVFDEFGKQRTAIDIFNDIAKAAAKLKAEDADKILSKIFSDRGGRLFYAMVREGNVELSKMVEHLQNVKPESLLDSAKGLMDTTKGALNILQGTLVGALDQVFEANSVKFKTFIKDLTGAIDSEGFKNTVHGIVAGVNSIYESIRTLMPVLQAFGAAWLVFKAGSIGVAVFQGVSAAIAGMAPILGMTGKQIWATTAALTTSTGAWVANGTAVIGNAAAQRAAAAGMDAAAASAARTAATTAVAGAGMRGVAAIVGFMANPIVGVITTLGLLGAAFFSAKSDAEKAMSGTTNSILENGKINLAQWDKEIARLRDRNALMGKTDTYSGAESELTVARENLAKESADYLKILNKYEQESVGASERQLSVLSSRYDRVLKSKLASITSQQETINKAQARVDEARMKDLSEREEEERQRAAKFKTAPHGDIPLPAGGRPGFDRRTYQDVKIASENTLSIIQKSYNTQKTLAQEQANDERAILEAKHKAMLIGEGRYQAELQASTLTSEQNLLRIAEESRAEHIAAFERQKSTIEQAIAKAEATPAKTQTDKDARAADVKRLQTDLENLDRTSQATLESMSADAKKHASNIHRYISIAAINSAGELRKLSEESRKYWKADAEELSKLRTADTLAAKYQFVADTILSTGKAEQAYEEASSAMMEKHLSRINELENKYSDVAAEAEYFAEVLRALGPAADEATLNQYTAAENRLKNLRKSIDAEKVNAANSATAAGELAFERMRKKQIGEFSSALSNGVMTGLEEGGEAGKKKLRDTIVSELKKPVFMVINAVVNAGLGAIFGGSSSAAAAGQAGGSALGSAGGSLMGSALGGIGAFGTGASYGATSLFANGLTGTLAAGGQMIGAGSVMSGLGTFAGALGPIALGIGLLSSAFSRKLKDQGIQGTLGGEAGFEGQQYRFYEGGLFRSDKTTYSAIDPELARVLTGSFSAVQDQVTNFAEALSLPTDRIKGFTTDIKVSFKGLDEAGIQKALQDALATGSNELAQQVLGTLTTTTREVTETLAGGMSDWGDGTMQTVTRTIEETTYAASEYAKEGEKAIDTLTRLSTSLTTVNTAFKNLGWTLMDKSLAGADAASKFAEQVGGLENFISLSNTYYENFYTEAERTANTTRDVAEALAKVGLEMPKTREGFRALVETQMALGESGTKAVAALLQVSGTFAEITPAADAAANSVDKLVSALERSFPTATTTIKNLVTELTNLSKLRNAAGNLKDKISRAMGGSEDFAKQREAELWAALAGTVDLEKQIELAQELSDIVIARQQKEVSAAESLLSFSKSLKDYVESLKLGDLSPLTAGQKLAEAGRQYAETLTKARSGDVGAQGRLESVASSYLTAARTYYASSSAYTDIFNNVTGALDTFSNSTATQAEQQLTTSNASLSELQKLYTTAEQLYASVDSQYNAAVEQLKIEKDTLLAQLTTVEQLQALQQILSGLPIELQGLFTNLLGGYFGSLSDLLRTAQANTPTYMLNDLNKIALQSGASQDQFQNISAKLYTDVEVAEMITHGQRNYATYTTEQLQKLGTSQYGITSEQFYKVLNNLDSLLARVPTEGYTANLLDGSHATGLSYVPFDGYVAELHKGERVVPASENTAYGNDSKELLAELAALRAAVESLQKSNREDTAAHISATIQAAEFSGQVVASAVAKTVQTVKVEEKARIR